jgi:hypothetical protein
VLEFPRASELKGWLQGKGWRLTSRRTPELEPRCRPGESATSDEGVARELRGELLASYPRVTRELRGELPASDQGVARELRGELLASDQGLTCREFSMASSSSLKNSWSSKGEVTTRNSKR